MPLANDLRPSQLQEVVGQSHLTQERSLFWHLYHSKHPSSLLFWGPPGCGKTTLAKIYASHFERPFYEFSAPNSSIGDMKNILDKQKNEPLFTKMPIVFLDEIHRFNKLQQDTFLPLLENGRLILIGATTENPSFALNPALLSRLNVFILYSLEESDLLFLIEKYEKQHVALPLDENGKKFLAKLSNGDARVLYNLIEAICRLEAKQILDAQQLTEFLPNQLAKYDQTGDGKYFLISALHKSLRGSDVDASLYWLCRMLIGGEDPLYLFRRLLRFASEDIGLADPNALVQVQNCCEAFQKVGLPEGEIFLAQSVIYLALSPKSNSAYKALGKALESARHTSQYPPPLEILNAPTKWMKSKGFGKGYIYNHDVQDTISGQNYFPQKVKPQVFYEPNERGFERQLKKYLDFYKKMKAKKQPYTNR